MSIEMMIRLLHVYVDGPTSKVSGETLSSLHYHGYLSGDSNSYTIAEKGEVYVKALLEVPEPVVNCEWVIKGSDV